MKILIFEDEIYHFHQLRHRLEEMCADYDVIGPIPSVEQGREYLSLHKDIDIIIADTLLHDGPCFKALKYAPADIPVIFTATTGEQAIDAFAFNSLSYLIKPISDDALAEAMQKARLLLAARALTATGERRDTRRQRHNKYRERFVVRAFNGERMISLSTIKYIVSEHKSTYLVLLDGTSCPIDLSLEAVADQLDPQKFMRVNRKYIVPAELVSGMERLVNGKELLRLKGNSSPEIIISRTRKAQVRKWLDN